MCKCLLWNTVVFVSDREQFQLGSLSHYINTKANGYQELPPFPLEAPDPKARDVEMPPVVTEQEPLFTSKKQSSKKQSFYSESDSPGILQTYLMFWSAFLHFIFDVDDEDEDSSSEDDDDDEEEEEETSSGKDGEESDTEDDESSEVEKKAVVILIFSWTYFL